MRELLVGALPATGAELAELAKNRIGVSRQAVHAQLSRMAKEGLILATGEGKVRHYGATLGPAIDLRQVEEGQVCVAERHMVTQIIYNLFEQQIGAPLIPLAARHGVGLMVRVPHSSGLLEGRYSAETSFTKDDHRFFRVNTDERKRAWLTEGLKKVERLAFLTEGTGRTLAQAAIRWILAEPCFACVLPNIYAEEQLVEFAAASDVPDLTAAELRRLRELGERNFDLAAVR